MGFPRGEWPEIESETGEERLKLYDYTGLYGAMLEEVERGRFAFPASERFPAEDGSVRLVMSPPNRRTPAPDGASPESRPRDSGYEGRGCGACWGRSRFGYGIVRRARLS